MRKCNWVWMVFVLLFALVVAAPASAGTKWTADKEGTGDEIDELQQSIWGGQQYAFYVFTTIEASGWLQVGKGWIVNICGTADITDAAANGVEYNILKSTLPLNVKPTNDFYSEIVLGVTLTGYGAGACVKYLTHGWYKIDVTNGPDSNTGMVSVLGVERVSQR